MSRYAKRNLRKRSRASRRNSNQQNRETRRENREDNSGENIELRAALNVPEESEQEVPSHVCDTPTTYSSFVTFNNMSYEAVSKLRNDIEKLKEHLSAAHAELADLSVENISFKKTISKYKKKVEFIDKIALGGPSEFTSEPGSSILKRFNEETPSTSGTKPYPKATCTVTVPDEENDDDDDSDYDDNEQKVT